MNEITREKKIKMISKYIKKQKPILELGLINYEQNDLYVCLSRSKKSNLYKLSWFSLAIMASKKLEDNISCAIIPEEVVNLIFEDFRKLDIDLNYKEKISDDEDNVVYLIADIPTKKSKMIDMKFQSYIPKKYECIKRIVSFIFSNMPLRYEFFYNELVAEINNDKKRFDYHKLFSFDLFKDNLDILFDSTISNKGKKYYDEHKVLFLEKVDNKYYAVVEGKEKYVTAVKYDENSKKMRVYCSCPCDCFCKHLYAVILSIRNKKFKKFYKVTFDTEKTDLLTRMISFNYIMCLGVYKDSIQIIDKNLEISNIPIVNNDLTNLKIIEDDKRNSLSKKINKYLKK